MRGAFPAGWRPESLARDPFRRLSRGGRTLPGGASRRVGARGTFSKACEGEKTAGTRPARRPVPILAPMTEPSPRRRFGPRLAERDPAVWAAIRGEEERQSRGLELIASENFASDAVMEANGSVMTNKYAEGYPGRRYYGGCVHVDRAERLARDRAKELFGGVLGERPAAQRLAGEHGRLPRGARPGRHLPRDGARPRRAPDPRPPAELLRPVLSPGALRGPPGGRTPRSRPVAPAGARAPAEDDHGRRERVSAPLPERRDTRDRRRDGRPGRHRHRPPRRSHRRPRDPEPAAVLRHRHHHDPQDAPRAARRAHPLEREALREGAEPDHLPRHPGRADDAHDRRERRSVSARRSTPPFGTTPARRSGTRSSSPTRWRRSESGSSPEAPTTTSSSSMSAPAG